MKVLGLAFMLLAGAHETSATSDRVGAFDPPYLYGTTESMTCGYGDGARCTVAFYRYAPRQNCPEDDPDAAERVDDSEGVIEFDATKPPGSLWFELVRDSLENGTRLMVKVKEPCRPHGQPYFTPLLMKKWFNGRYEPRP